MSTKMSRLQRDVQGYDPKPPTCGQCVHFQPGQQGRPEVWKGRVLLHPALPFKPTTCLFPLRRGLGNPFAVRPGAICNEWTHKVTKEKLA